MNEQEAKKKREWVKNAAIIFLSVMLVLTFFSNTIMNYSLPEVATQYVQSGSITAKIRGTGNVEASDPYNVMAKESRVIASVAVKQGDVVEKDAVIYYLEDAESEELTKAEEELEALQLAYMKGLFGANVSAEIISKVANGNVDGFNTLQNKVASMQNRIDAAEARVKECQDIVDQITLQSTINTNDSSVNTIPEENEKNQAATGVTNATTAETDAETAFNNLKAQQIAEINAQIAQKKKEISDAETIINSANSLNEPETSTGTSGSASGGTISATEALNVEFYIKNLEDADALVATELHNIFVMADLDPSYSGTEDITQLKAWIDERPNPDPNPDDLTDRQKQYASPLNAYNAAVAQQKYASDKLNEVRENLNNYDDNTKKLIDLKKELTNLENQLIAKQAQTYTPGDSVEQAQAKLNQATQNLNDKTNSNKQAAVAYQNKLANANAALKNAQAVLEIVKAEQTQMTADINAELDLSKANKDIIEKEEEIAKLKEKSMGAAIKAPVAGTISSLAYVAGETTKPEEPAAVMQPDGKGFTLSISVTNEQAKKVQIGDPAELQNAWYYDDVQISLTAIKPDTENPGSKKLLVFDVTGASIQSGQSLSISVGQRSSDYELVVPNSAICEDNNGKFILIVESKSSPLGNRYVATRVDVEVLASDDNNSAISAGLYGYEYVITTSTKPVEAGKQVRLNES